MTLGAYPIQQPSGNPGGKINVSFKFKMVIHFHLMSTILHGFSFWLPCKNGTQAVVQLVWLV